MNQQNKGRATQWGRRKPPLSSSAIRPPAQNFGNTNQVFDSRGPDVRVRGTAIKLHQHYLDLAADALSREESVQAENFFQFAEHYLRTHNAILAARPAQEVRREVPASDP